MKRKLIVFGGSGYVGGNIAKVALSDGWEVVCVSRKGKPRGVPPTSALSQWVHDVSWEPCNALHRDEVRCVFEAHPDATAVVSAIGALSISDTAGRRKNGDTNQNVAALFYENPSISKFVFVSAAPLPLMTYIMRGYYEGKWLVEEAVTKTLKDRGAVALRPGFVYGSRPLRYLVQYGAFFPLQLFGIPLELLFRPFYTMTKWRIFTPPINVNALSRAALYACYPDTKTPLLLEYGDMQQAAAEFEANSGKFRETGEAAAKEGKEVK